jgi:hypothetical protein
MKAETKAMWKVIIRYLIMFISTVLFVLGLSWIILWEPFPSFITYVKSILTDFTTVIVLLFTAIVISDYTYQTKRMADETKKMVFATNNEIKQVNRQIDKMSEQNRILRDQYNTSIKPVIKHELFIQEFGQDYWEIHLKIKNRSNYEVFSKVYLDILVDDDKVLYINEDLRKRYQGEMYWIIEPMGFYKGHFPFGLWFLDGHQKYNDYHKYDYDDENKSNWFTMNALLDKYKDKKITFKFRHSSISIHKQVYYSAIYSYDWDMDKSGLLIPQVCDLVLRQDIPDYDAMKEFDFGDIIRNL